MNNIYHMAQFLPRTVRIAKTPDFAAYDQHEVAIEVVELKTEDVIAAFLGMQKMAIYEANKLRDAEARRKAIARIRAMTHFGAQRPA